MDDVGREPSHVEVVADSRSEQIDGSLSGWSVGLLVEIGQVVEDGGGLVESGEGAGRIDLRRACGGGCCGTWQAPGRWLWSRATARIGFRLSHQRLLRFTV